MPFFELPRQQASPEQAATRRKRQDNTAQRPSLVVPRYLPTDLVLAVNDERAVVIHGIACYPNGFAFQLEAVSPFEYERDGQPVFEPSPLSLFQHHGRFSLEDIPDSELRFGIEYSNGGRITTLDLASGFYGKDPESDAPRMLSPGGSGGAGSWRHELWVWPLPPEGPVTFACEWPAYGIPETKKKLDGERFRAAAAQARPLFT